MKLINLKELSEFLYSPEIIEESKKILFSQNIMDFQIKEIMSQWIIRAKICNYDVEIKITYENFSECKCNCDIYLLTKKICSHIICLTELYNQYVTHNLSQYKQVKDVSFNVVPIFKNLENNEKKIEIKFYFEYNYKKIFISNIKDFFLYQDKFYFFPLLYFEINQINEESIKLIEVLSKMFKERLILFDLDHITIENDELDYWVAFFNNFNVPLFYENETNWTITEYYLDFYNYEFDEQSKASLNNKRRFILKVSRDLNIFYLTTPKNVFLFVNSKAKYTTKVYKYEINKIEYIKDFCGYLNKQISKNNFYKLYLAIRNLFENFERIIEYLFIIKNSVFKIDPVLEIKVYFEKFLNVLVAKLAFFYGETEYPYNEKETNYFKRERFLEQKLLEPLLTFFHYYNNDFKVFEIVDQQKYLEFIEWSKKMSKNDLYDIKFAENLIFKPKNRRTFYVNSSSYENDFLKIEWSIDGFSKEDMYKIISAYKQKLKYVTLSNNKMLNLELEIDFDKLSDDLKLLNTSVNNFNNGTVLINKLNSNYFFENFDFPNKEELKNYYQKLYGNVNNTTNELPENLKKILKNYQITGYLWLKKLLQLNAGGILADEMGLGKTIQSLALLSDIYFNKKTSLPSLIVCPSSLVYNWKKEFNEYAPFLKIGIIDGSQSERLEIFDKINNYQVVITSYHLLNKDIEIYKNIEFYLQILDEAQKIKNHYTQFSKDSKSINSKFKIALTGTPIENNPLELWSIFDYLMPNFLYDYKTFKTHFQEKIVNKDEATLTKLKTKIAPFILRRTKEEVLKELPSKMYKIMTCDFDETQKQMYLTELNKSKLIIKKGILDNSINRQGIYIFSVLTKLRQICCSPKLIYENSTTNGSKFNLCIDLIKDLIKNNDRILLFSQFTSMIALIAQELTKLKINFLILTGETNKKERIDLVNEFNKNKRIKVFLISLKAGGTGLTLTSANAVIHYDPWWNLSLENQATDRAHRIGQEKNVFIYKLIAKGSIEEKIIALQESKREIIEQVFSENSPNQNSISFNEILEILEIN